MDPVRRPKPHHLIWGDSKARRHGGGVLLHVYNIGGSGCLVLETAHAVLELLDFGVGRGQETGGPFLVGFGDNLSTRRRSRRRRMRRAAGGRVGDVSIGAAEVMARALARTAGGGHVAAHLSRPALFARLGLALPLSHGLHFVGWGCHGGLFRCVWSSGGDVKGRAVVKFGLGITRRPTQLLCRSWAGVCQDPSGVSPHFDRDVDQEREDRICCYMRTITMVEPCPSQ